MQINTETVKSKICGVVGDGAFMRKNEPFKKRLSELLDRYKLTFRWDLLHLANRAHMAARGCTDYEKQMKTKEIDSSTETAEDDDDIIFAESTDATKLSELIDYIQCNAKKNRTGIIYTGLKIDDSHFKRPKIWSATRMCLFEYDMTHRFLENKLYFEVIYLI